MTGRGAKGRKAGEFFLPEGENKTSRKEPFRGKKISRAGIKGPRGNGCFVRIVCAFRQTLEEHTENYNRILR